ncbi:MAG: VCBS repeat-containing protein [Planctomycetes bacterium]|nr:VCBS repeat-containing protein [Planctomycetota bacterium]
MKKQIVSALVIVLISMSYSYGQNKLIQEQATDSGKPWKQHQIYKKSRLCNGLDPADFNRDGLVDYVTNFEDAGRIVLVLHPGAAQCKQNWPSVLAGQFDRVESSCAGDLDGDSWPDVAVAHGHENADEKAGITVIWNPGQRNRVTSPDAWVNSDFIPGSIELGNYLFIRSADINGDGAIDIVAGGRQARNATPAHENPDPSLPSVGVIWLEAPVNPSARRNMTQWQVHDIDGDIISGHGFHLGDIDGDGDLDVALANSGWGTPKGGEYVQWYENPGHGSALQRVAWPKHTLYQNDEFYTKPGVVIADIDCDGHVDILSQINDRVLYFRNQGNNPTEFQRVDIPKPDYANWRSRPIAVADLNADSSPEVIVGLIHHDGLFPKDKAAILVMERMNDSNSKESWRSHVIKWADGFRGKGRFDGEKWDNFFFDDVDKDGDLDIVTNCEEYKKLGVEWFENPGNL